MLATFAIRSAIAAALLGCFIVAPVCASSAVFGPADPMAMDQPRVAVELVTTDTGQSIGPEYANTFLLDTGAQGLMAVGYAVTEMVELGYQVEGSFNEIGIGGISTFDLSATYDFHFAGTDGTPYVIPDARIVSDESLNFGGFGGVVGTPAMTGRVTTLDMTAMLGSGEWWDFGYIGVDFSDTLPAGGADRYTVPVEMVDFPAPEQVDPNAPLPTYGPLPFVPVRIQVSETLAGGMFVLDTGAQISMLSTAVAIDAGLDTNGNGTVWDEAIAYTSFSGVSGEVEVPIVAIDKLIVPTREGVDLIWTDLELPVYDIDPAILGIFGSDLLTTGYFRGVFETGDPGIFNTVHFDFRDANNAALLVDVNDQYDLLVQTVDRPGDANGDGLVDLDDFVILKKHYSLSPAAWGDADFTADGTVDLSDFVVLKKNIFTEATVPEPSAPVLLLLAALARRRRR